MLCALGLSAQVKMMPMIVFIDPATRSGYMTLSNPENEAKEVVITFKKAAQKDLTGKDIIVKDSSGKNILLKDSANFSLTDYIKVFPKKLVIPGRSDRTIRFLASLPPYLPDGSYWSQISITTKPTSRKLYDDSTAVRAGLVLKIEMITLVIFQKGKQTSNLEISDLQSKQVDDTLKLLVGYKNSGNALFFGRIKMPIYDEKGDLVENIYEILTIDKEYKKVYTFSKSKMKSGKYRAEINIDNEIEEIPEPRRTKFNPIKREFEIIVP